MSKPITQASFEGAGVPVLTAKGITEALRVHYVARASGPQWLVLPELRIGTGYGKDAEQRIDLWVMHMWPSEHFKRIAFEIKVSRSDFLAELRAPQKRKRALLYSNEFYFAAPAGLIKVEELPVEAGLVEVAANGWLNWRVGAPWRDTPMPSWRFLAAVARRLRDTTRGEGA